MVTQARPAPQLTATRAQQQPPPLRRKACAAHKTGQAQQVCSRVPFDFDVSRLDWTAVPTQTVGLVEATLLWCSHTHCPQGLGLPSKPMTLSVTLPIRTGCVPTVTVTCLQAAALAAQQRLRLGSGVEPCRNPQPFWTMICGAAYNWMHSCLPTPETCRTSTPGA